LRKNVLGIRINWDDLQGEKDFSSFFAYQQSKLCNILFTIELAERLKGLFLASKKLTF